jgi:hypothetical protein
LLLNKIMKKNKIFQYFALVVIIFVSIYSIQNTNDLAKDKAIETKIDKFHHAVDIFVKTEGHYPNGLDQDYTCIAPEGSKCYFNNLEIEAVSLEGTDFEVFLEDNNIYSNNISSVSASDVFNSSSNYKIEDIPVIEYKGAKYGGGILYACVEELGEDCADARVLTPTREALSLALYVVQAGNTNDPYNDDGDTCTRILPGSQGNCIDYCQIETFFSCEEGGSESGTSYTSGNICQPPDEISNPTEYRWTSSCGCQERWDSYRCDGSGGTTQTDKWFSTGVDNCSLIPDDVCNPTDCADVVGGDSEINDCGICSLDPDEGKDECGVCFGGIDDPNECPGGGGDDQCPNDPNKVAPGVCGCGVPDVDSDNDETLDCNDACPDVADGVKDVCKNCVLPEDAITDPNQCDVTLDLTYTAGECGTGDVTFQWNTMPYVDYYYYYIEDDYSYWWDEDNLYSTTTLSLDLLELNEYHALGDIYLFNLAAYGLDYEDDVIYPVQSPDACPITSSCGSIADTNNRPTDSNPDLCGEDSRLSGSVSVVGDGWGWTCESTIDSSYATSCNIDCADGSLVSDASGVCVVPTINNCGTAADSGSVTEPSSNLCKSGSSLVDPVSANSSNNSWEWTCTDSSVTCRSNIISQCGTATGIVAEEPSSNFCSSGSQFDSDNGINVANGTEWEWRCLNSDALPTEVSSGRCVARCGTSQAILGDQCVNTLGIDTNLNPRIVNSESAPCRFNYSIEVPADGAVNCSIVDAEGVEVEQVLSGDQLANTYEGSFEQDGEGAILPRKSYSLSCTYDELSDGLDIISISSDSVSCIINPAFIEF